MLSDEQLALLTLSLTPGLNGNRLLGVIRSLPDLKLVLTAGTSELRSLAGLNMELAAAVQLTRSSSRAQEMLRRCQLLGVKLLFLGQESYPALLAQLATPPVVVYVRGNPAVLQGAAPLVAVVGTRAGSRAGLDYAFSFAEALAEAGATVVSGLALGTDGQAHRGALQAQGTTVAVIASGIDQVTPRTHAALGRRIEEVGALLSEYPPGVPPAPWQFPVRNRIIAGLCSVTVVLEAGARSGALHTARAALEEGRSVFALPGRPGDSRTVGSVSLLTAGAIPLTGVDLVLRELRLERATNLLAALPLDLRELALTCATLGPATLEELAEQLPLGVPALLAQVNHLKLLGVLSEDETGIMTLLDRVPQQPARSAARRFRG